MLPKPNQCPTTSRLHIVVSQPEDQTSETRYMLQDTENGVGNLPAVCRVCLAMGVRMYHMSDHELSAMYTRITGVVINTEEKLPQQLCWECVARLSSANNFILKALRTHWMLSNKISSGRFLTLSDITSIDRAQHQLESRLSNHLINNDDKCNSYFFECSVKTDVKKEILSDLDSNNYNRDYPDKKNCKCEEKIKVDICISDDTINEELDTVKTELLDIDDKPGNTLDDINSDEENTIVKYENEEMLVDNESYNDFYELEDVNFSKNSSQDFCKHQSANGVQCLKKSEMEDEENLEDSLECTIEASRYEAIEIKSISDSDDVDHTSSASSSCVNTTNSIYTTFSNCIYCPYKARSKYMLDKHINTEHTKSTVNNCSYCSYKTHRKADLFKHINSRHTKRTSYNCPYCSYKAYQTDNLRRHVNSQHTKSTCYYCTHCSYESYCKAALKKHKISKHTKTKSV